MSGSNGQTHSAQPQSRENKSGRERGGIHSVFFWGLMYVHCLFSLPWCLDEPLGKSGGRNDWDGTRPTLGWICTTGSLWTRLLDPESQTWLPYGVVKSSVQEVEVLMWVQGWLQGGR